MQTVTIDGRTGQILSSGPEWAEDPGTFAANPAGGPGFGFTRKFLDTQPILTAPWLTPELAKREIEIGGFK